MTAIPSHKYTLSAVDSRELALNWFKKMYPDLSKIGENEFEDAAFGIFDICKNLIGTESTSANGPGFGGSHGEIRTALAAAIGIAIVFEDDEVRHFKNSTIAQLTAAWLTNDHASFLARCAGYERNATNAKIDLLPVAKELDEGVWEILDEEETQVDEVDPVVAEFAATVGEVTSTKRFVTGNRHRRRMVKKPPTRQQKLLEFGCVV